MDCIYIHHFHANEKLIQNSHNFGLQVIVHSVNDSSILSKWCENFPDGIICDDKELCLKIREGIQSGICKKNN